MRKVKFKQILSLHITIRQDESTDEKRPDFHLHDTTEKEIGLYFRGCFANSLGQIPVLTIFIYLIRTNLYQTTLPIY